MKLNPKYMDDLDLVDLVYQKDPFAYECLVRDNRIIRSHKDIVATFKEVYPNGLENNNGRRGSINVCTKDAVAA